MNGAWASILAYGTAQMRKDVAQRDGRAHWARWPRAAAGVVLIRQRRAQEQGLQGDILESKALTVQ